MTRDSSSGTYTLALLLVKLKAPWAPPMPLRRAKNCSTRMKIKGGTTQLRAVVMKLGRFGGAAANSTPCCSSLWGRSMSKIGVVASTEGAPSSTVLSS